jgi:hypothetical protein
MLPIVADLLNGLRRLEARQRRECRNRREEVRIRDHELPLNDAVVTQRGQGVREREAVVKYSEAGADHGLRERILAACPWRPRDSDARRDITPVVDVGLRFIAQPQTRREIWRRYRSMEVMGASVTLPDESSTGLLLPSSTGASPPNVNVPPKYCGDVLSTTSPRNLTPNFPFFK